MKVRDKQGHQLIEHACEICGTIRYIRTHNGKPLNTLCKPCSKGKPKDFHRVNGRGYRILYIVPESQFYPLAQKSGAIFEHRLVVAHVLLKRLGSIEAVKRELTEKEIHHIDGNTINNKLHNLLLLTHGAHSRLHRLQEWAVDGVRRRIS